MDEIVRLLGQADIWENEVLWQIADRAGRKRIKEIIADRKLSDDVRLLAVSALTLRFPDDDTLEFMMGFSGERELFCRMVSFAGLRIKSPRTVSFMVRVLNTPDELAQTKALSWLMQEGHHGEAREAVTKTSPSILAITFLEYCCPEIGCVITAAELLSHSDWTVRRAAANSLTNVLKNNNLPLSCLDIVRDALREAIQREMSWGEAEATTAMQNLFVVLMLRYMEKMGIVISCLKARLSDNDFVRSLDFV